MTQLGFRGLVVNAQSLAVSHGFMLGRWDDATTEFEALVDLCGELEERPPFLKTAAGARALIALHRREREAAAAALSAAAGIEALHVSHLAALARALVAESSRLPGEALDTLARAWDLMVASGLFFVCLHLGPDLVRLGRAYGDLPRALDACERVEAIAAANPGVATIRGTARRCRGLLEDDPGMLVEAANSFRDSPRPLDAALAYEDAGDALGRAGEPAAARGWFDEALRTYDRLEASWDLSRATARMRSLSIRRGTRVAQRPPKAGWEALTRGERAVVELVAEGLSNPEVAERLYLSRQTVKRHLANAMAKLDITSRIELARDASRRRA